MSPLLSHLAAESQTNTTSSFDMEHDKLLQAIFLRATNPKTRTDYSNQWPCALPPKATLEQVRAAERELNTQLYPFHQDLLIHVGNGGFGPGNGLIGLQGGHTDDGLSLVELTKLLLPSGAVNDGQPLTVPLCDWGSGSWSLINAINGHVLTLDESGLFDTDMLLETYMSIWAEGAPLVEKLFTFKIYSGIDPFTKKPIDVRMRGSPLGERIDSVR